MGRSARTLITAFILAISLLLTACDKVKRAINDLNNKDATIRMNAAAVLGTMKDPRAVEPLINALKDEDVSVRVNAAWALGTIKDARAVEPLIAAMNGSNPNASNALVSIIIDTRNIEPLIAAMKNKNANVRGGIAIVLGVIKDTHAVEPLIAALRDEDWGVRKHAADALASIKNTRAVKPLISVLRDNDSHVRDAAVWALLEIKDARAVRPLIATLNDSNSDVRLSAVHALLKFNNAKAVESVIAAIKNELKNEDAHVRYDAVNHVDNLMVMSDKRAINLLIEALTDWHINERAANGLSKRGWLPQSDKDRIHLHVAERNGNYLRENWHVTKNILLKDIESINYFTIENALYAFMGIGREEIIPILIEKLNTKGTKIMAEAYLNCGHDKLDKAARDWATRNGYSIIKGHGASPIGWGRM